MENYPKLIANLPQKYLDAISDVSDERNCGDGYWIYLKPGFISNLECGIVHEHSIKKCVAELKAAVDAKIKSLNMTETILYGCKIGEPAYMEEVLAEYRRHLSKEEKEREMEKVTAWGKKNGYDRIRFSDVDLSVPPVFGAALVKK